MANGRCARCSVASVLWQRTEVSGKTFTILLNSDYIGMLEGEVFVLARQCCVQSLPGNDAGLVSRWCTR